MSSDPKVKQRIVKRLKKLQKKGVNKVSSDTFAELQAKLKLKDVSATCFKKALGSLAFNPKNPDHVTVARGSWDHRDTTEERPVTVFLS